MQFLLVIACEVLLYHPVGVLYLHCYPDHYRVCDVTGVVFLYPVVLGVWYRACVRARARVCLVRAVQPDIVSQEMRENLKLSLLFVDTRIAHS